MRMLLWLFVLIIAVPRLALGDEQPDSLLSMSLEELSQVKVSVPAALTRLTSLETPASITTITAEDIALTPARNIYDLIETYVPGAFWMNYEEGPALGIRGSVTDRAYKYLLRVNGRVVNNKGHFGAKSELEQWDLADILRIEVVRGPGSVTYGPGAVAGVINIITHSAKTAEGLKVSARWVSEYRSIGATVSHGYRDENVSLFATASVTRTEGTAARHFLGSNGNTPGFVGEGIQMNTAPLGYFGDYDHDPQIKAHIDMTFRENWRFWLRYTQQGSHWAGNETKTDFGGALLNQQGTSDRQWVAALEYNDAIREDILVSVTLSADSLDAERRKSDFNNPDPAHALNMKTDFSETEIQFRSLLNWQANDKVEVAVGLEYSWDQFGPGWGDDEIDMRLGDDGVIVSGTDSNAYAPGMSGSADKNGTALFVGDGWSTSTYSVLAEINLTPNPRLTALFSARLDKNDFSDLLISPRVAFMVEVAEGHYLKLIGQQAQRMNTGGQLFSLDQSGADTDPETITAVELIYSASPRKNFTMGIAGFWHDLEVLGWNEDDDTTRRIGDLRLVGIEPEVSYQGKNGKFGASYSYIRQLDWELASGLTSSGVSYSDFNQPLRGSAGVQTGEGDNLNNWFNHALKVYERINLTEKLLLHVDGRLQWGYEGAKDGLEALRKAVAGDPIEATVLTSLQAVEDQGTYDYQFRLNASLSWEPKENLFLRFYAQNLLGTGSAKRYSLDTGANRASPHRVRFVEEPRTYGIRLDYAF